MNRVCSIFAQRLQKFPRHELEAAGNEQKAERHAPRNALRPSAPVRTPAPGRKPPGSLPHADLIRSKPHVALLQQKPPIETEKR